MADLIALDPLHVSFGGQVASQYAAQSLHRCIQALDVCRNSNHTQQRYDTANTLHQFGDGLRTECADTRTADDDSSKSAA